MVRQGDVAPVDGILADGLAVLDLSVLTGESIPIQRSRRKHLERRLKRRRSLRPLATRLAAYSTYAGIIRLVEAAQRSSPPISRLADRFALASLATTLALSLGASFFSGDPIRTVAVLVSHRDALPLILAVPIAIIAGLSRAAEYGISRA
jgi:cation transport ATPase